MYENWDWNEIIQFGTDKRLGWQFTKSSDAPWENGCSESLIKLAKRNMMTSIGSQVVTFNELQSLVFEIAILLNQRPVGIKSIDKVEMTHLCPNDLILGRASTCLPCGNFSLGFHPKKRHMFVQRLADEYWKRWVTYYFRTLLIRQKWHTSSRNLCEGDVVMVQETGAIRGAWRLAEVVELCLEVMGK